MGEEILKLEMRRRIVDLVRRYPGLHLREIARQLDTSVALVEYHVPLLVEADLVRIFQEDRYRRLFPYDPQGTAGKEYDPRRVSLLRDRHALGIVLHLLEDGPLRHKDLAERMTMGKSRLSFHLEKLRAAQLVTRHEDGTFAVQDPTGTQRLLVTHKPTPDLRDRFADLWVSLYQS